MALAGCERETSLTVMTYNVGVFDKYMEDSTEDIAALVKSLGVDVVALNELDSCNTRHDACQLKDFAEALGEWNYAYSSSIPFAGGSYGNGIATCDDILFKEKVLLPMSDGAEQRSMVVVETERYVIACTHLDHIGENARLDQVTFIDSWMRERYGHCQKPVLLCGDMNSTPDMPAVRELLKRWSLLSVTEYTWPSQHPVKCLDYVFCLDSRQKPRAIKSWIPVEKDIEKYSDHLPVVVTIKIK